MLRIGTLLLAAICLSLFRTSAVKACECDPPPPREVYKMAAAVFVGEVVEINDSKVNLFESATNVGSWAVKFRVVRYWKGVKGTEITVHSDLGGLPCHQFRFEKDGTYLVYADGKKLIAITGCTRSGPIDAPYVIEQLKGMGKGKVPKVSSRD